MNDILFEKLVMRPEISKLPIGEQSDMIRAFTEVIEQIGEENPDADIQSLLNPATAG